MHCNKMIWAFLIYFVLTFLGDQVVDEQNNNGTNDRCDKASR
jgi:hypothetical protein